jgi:hypothetical protein
VCINDLSLREAAYQILAMVVPWQIFSQPPWSTYEGWVCHGVFWWMWLLKMVSFYFSAMFRYPQSITLERRKTLINWIYDIILFNFKKCRLFDGDLRIGCKFCCWTHI